MHILLIILREEFLIVLFSESLVLLCLRFFSRRILLHLFKCLIVYVLLRRIDDIDEVHHKDCKEVTPHPVQTYARGNDECEKRRKGDHEYGHSPLRELVLLYLEDVYLVLNNAHQQRGKTGEHRD